MDKQFFKLDKGKLDLKHLNDKFSLCKNHNCKLSDACLRMHMAYKYSELFNANFGVKDITVKNPKEFPCKDFAPKYY